MPTQREKAELFASLHQPGDPIVLFNVWDVGTAKAVADAGARAIATGSWSVAAAHGYLDAEKLPMQFALDNARRIVKAVELPVTLDFEAGYAKDLTRLKSNIDKVLDTGVVGINFEDQIVRGEGLQPIEAQQERILTIRRAADRHGVKLFINARTDVFLKNPPDTHREHFPEALKRASAYAYSTASGIFAPGLKDPDLIREMCAATNLPVNVMVMADTPSNAELAALGVGRISHGPGPYRQMIAALTEAARKAFA